MTCWNRDGVGLQPTLEACYVLPSVFRSVPAGTRSMDKVTESLFPARQERFGYTCHRCLRCCHHKIIHVDPYEISRLARNRGVTTTDFRVRWTMDGAGTTLAQTDDGACVFLGTEGCTVHADRPLVCRLYPLGRHVIVGGDESFCHLKPHPQSEGEYSANRTIAEFLEEQDAALFIQAADEYLQWLDDAINVLSKEADALAPAAVGEPMEGDDRLLDMDVAITAHCAEGGIPEPDDLEDRKRLHLHILYDHLSKQGGKTT